MEIREYFDNRISFSETIRNGCGADTNVEIIMDESEQRMIISWLAKNRLSMLQDVLCENCPEVC